MKTITSLLFILLLMTACGGKKAQTTFSLNAGALFSGSTPVGGVVILGKSGVHKFSVGLTAAQANTFSIDLPQGEWNFIAMAWLDQLGEGVMSGKARCGLITQEIQGSDSSVALSLTNESCASDFFGAASIKDTTSYSGETTFKKINFNSCNNPVGYPGVCDSSSIEALPGESVSLKLVIPGYSNFGNTPTSLESACLNPLVHANGLIQSNLRVPISSSPLPVILKGYEKLNCVDPDPVYALTNNIDGLGVVDHLIQTITTTDYMFSFADNFVGKTGSPFIDAQNSGKIKLPIINCGGTCYNTTNKTVDYSFAKDEARQGVWSLFGTADAKETDQFVASSEALYTMVNGASGQVLINTSSVLGSKGNNIVLTFASAGPSGDTASVVCDSNNKTIDITATDDVTPAVVSTAINANCTGFLTSSTVNPASGGLFPPGTFNFSGGFDSFNGQGRREHGSVNDIKHILFGAVGAILYVNNIQTWTQLCSAFGSYSYQLPNDSVIITLSSPTASAQHPNFSANPASTFERKLLININGQNEEALFFNCLHGDASNEDYAVGTYISYKNDNRLEYVQTSWDVTTPDGEWVDRSIQQTENGFTMWRYDLFKHEATGDKWQYWAMSGSDQFTSYRRIAASTNGTPGSIFASSYDTGSTTDTTETFLSGGQKEWSVTSGNYLSAGGNISTEPDGVYASMTNPRTYPSFSMNDMINNAAFWNFNY